MMLVVTGVGFLIHLYATSYMEEDKGYRALLRVPEPLHLLDARPHPGRQPARSSSSGGRASASARTCSSASGTRTTPNAAAGKKAFIANRIGDFGLLCAMFLLVVLHGRARLERHRERRDEPRRTPASALPRPRLAARRRAVRRASLALPAAEATRSRSAPRRPSASRCSSAAPARARRSRSTSGSPTRWPAPRRSPRSSTRRRWSPPASTSSAACRSCSCSRRSR